jgi:predicted neuraminidase
MKRLCTSVIFCLAVAIAGAFQAATPIVRSEFIYDIASFPSAHASTIVETRSGLVAAWFGGTAERNPDVAIWVARHDGKQWSPPVEVANGVQSDGTRFPCWNPVLFQPPNGPLVLFYKVGPNPRAWWGLVRTSSDAGRTWSEPAKLPDGILGPIRAKPLLMADGTLLAGSSTEHDGWIVHMERYTPGLVSPKPKGEGGPVPPKPKNEGGLAAPKPSGEGGWTTAAIANPKAWEKTGPLNEAKDFGAIQPTILVHSHTRLQILNRSQQQVITEAWSEDGGRTWGRMTATVLPNPSAGIDAVRLQDKRFALIYNPTPKGRERLEIALSNDGKTWRRGVELENSSPGEYSYPAMIQTRDGMIHATYTWQRKRIKHVVVDPARMPKS